MRTFPAIIAVAILASAAEARANCAMPYSYDAEVTGNTVQIHPSNFGQRECPDPSGLLREAVDTGTVVRLADFCVDTTQGPAYLDECVPPGTYRYGYASPYTADCSAACSVDYYVQTTVTEQLVVSCALSPGNAAPSAAGSAPWADDPTICTYQEDPCSFQPCGGSGGQAPAEAAEPSNANGCTFALPAGTAPVLGINALALGLGLALMRYRRRR